jgi:Uma2 family endonuclease
MSMLDELGSIVLDTRSLGGFTDDEFYKFCLDNRDLKFERDEHSNIIVMSNTGGKTGNYNSEVLIDLGNWNRLQKMGFCFDSSTAFRLLTSAVRSPDAAWVKKERWNALTEKEREQFPPLCPDFVLEIKSPSDTLVASKNKMDEWVRNGATLAWLINPEEKLTYVYFANQVKTIPFSENLSGESVLKGFEIKLSSIFR